MNNDTISLKELIAPTFYKIHKYIKEKIYTYFWLKGGRNSTKSSFVSIEIILGLLRDKNANACVFMKYACGLRDSAYAQIEWAINRMGLSSYFKKSLSPMRMTYIPTNQHIFFKGLDDAEKTKSIKLTNGYFSYIWYEELSAFNSWAEIRTSLNSLFRKNDKEEEPKFTVFLTYNPPQIPSNWVNVDCKKKREDRIIHHSTYLDVPRKWLTNDFINEAERQKEINFREYEWEYLGEVTGVSGLIYPMFDKRVHVIPIKDFKFLPNEKVHTIYCGVDVGTINDATTCNILCLTNAGRVVRLPGFYYDPKLPTHTPLPASDQAVLIERWINYWTLFFGVYMPSSTLVVVDSSAPDVVLEFNRRTQYKAISVPKKDILIDLKRVQGMLSIANYFISIDAGYIDPLAIVIDNNQKLFNLINIDKNKYLLDNEDMLINEFTSLCVNPNTGKPYDGDDHMIDGLKYGTYLIFYGNGGY